MTVNGLKLGGVAPTFAGGLTSTLGCKLTPPLICSAKAVPEPVFCQ